MLSITGTVAHIDRAACSESSEYTWMKALMCAAGQDCDWTDKKYLIPLMEFLGKKGGFCEKNQLVYSNES